MLHRHVWKIVDRIEHPSPFEQIAAMTNVVRNFESSSTMFRRDVIVTRRCEVCGTEDVRRA